MNSTIYYLEGKIKNYPTFSPSFKRIKKTKEPIKHCTEWIKKEEFKELFTRTPYFERLPKEIGCMGLDFDFDLEALAQHYEFKTNYLDITKNFTIALFLHIQIVLMASIILSKISKNIAHTYM